MFFEVTMEINPRKRFHRTNFLVLLSCLMIIVIGMIYVVYLTTSVFGKIESESMRNLLHHIAWVGFVGLTVGLMGMLWIAVRWMRYVLVLRKDFVDGESSESEYVDAWSEAGKRMEAPDEDELEE